MIAWGGKSKVEHCAQGCADCYGEKERVIKWIYNSLQVLAIAWITGQLKVTHVEPLICHYIASIRLSIGFDLLQITTSSFLSYSHSNEFPSQRNTYKALRWPETWHIRTPERSQASRTYSVFTCSSSSIDRVKSFFSKRYRGHPIHLRYACTDRILSPRIKPRTSFKLSSTRSMPMDLHVVIGGDGRYFSPETVQTILKIGSANGTLRSLLSARTPSCLHQLASNIIVEV